MTSLITKGLSLYEENNIIGATFNREGFIQFLNQDDWQEAEKLLNSYDNDEMRAKAVHLILVHDQPKVESVANLLQNNPSLRVEVAECINDSYKSVNSNVREYFHDLESIVQRNKTSDYSQ